MNLDFYCGSCGKSLGVEMTILSSSRLSVSVRPCGKCKDAAYNRGAAVAANRPSGDPVKLSATEPITTQEQFDTAIKSGMTVQPPCSCEVYQVCMQCNPEQYQKEVARRETENVKR